MLRFIPVLFILISCLFALAIFVTPFSGDFATQQYTLRNTEHTLSSALCPNPSKVPVISRSGLEAQVDIMRTVSDALVSNRICFLAMGDTLKGILQNRGALPWVDRGDLAFFLKDLPRIVQLRTHFERKGLLLLRERDGYRVCKNNWKRFPFVFLHILEDTRKEGHESGKGTMMESKDGSFAPASGSIGNRGDVFSRPNTPDAAHWKNQYPNVPSFDRKSQKQREKTEVKLAGGKRDSFEFDTDFEEDASSSVCSDPIEPSSSKRTPGAEWAEYKASSYERDAQFSICTPLNELNEPTWNSDAFNHTMAWENVFPLQTMPFEDFSLPVPRNPHLILQDTPKALVRATPENDFDILFRNSAMTGLKNRLTNKFNTLIA